MLKFKLHIIALVFLALITGCNPTDKNEKKNNKPASPKTAVEGDVIELTGKLVCVHCLALNDSNTGLDHQLPESGFVKDCAQKCAKQNYPIGILLSSKQYGTDVWVIRTSGDTFQKYMTKTLTVKGEYVTSGLIEPKSLKVKDGEKTITLM